jgi:hypothetical protein
MVISSRFEWTRTSGAQFQNFAMIQINCGCSIEHGPNVGLQAVTPHDIGEDRVARRAGHRTASSVTILRQHAARHRVGHASEAVEPEMA